MPHDLQRIIHQLGVLGDIGIDQPTVDEVVERRQFAAQARIHFAPQIAGQFGNDFLAADCVAL